MSQVAVYHDASELSFVNEDGKTLLHFAILAAALTIMSVCCYVLNSLKTR